MTTPETTTVSEVVANLDTLGPLIDAYDQAVAEAAKWAKAVETLKKRIQVEMGDRTEGTVAGALAFTYRHTGQFAAKRFTNEHAELAQQYTVMRPALDTDALAADHPNLFTAYRARRFERKA